MALFEMCMGNSSNCGDDVFEHGCRDAGLGGLQVSMESIDYSPCKWVWGQFILLLRVQIGKV